MIIISNETNIFNIKADYLVNPANSIGWMGGFLGKYIPTKGVAEAIHYKTKGAVEKESKVYCKYNKPQLGNLFITNSHLANCDKIIHIITVKYPGFSSSLEHINIGLSNLSLLCQKQKISSCIITGLGTGTGNVNKSDVAYLFQNKLMDLNTKFYLVDKSNDFIKLFK